MCSKIQINENVLLLINKSIILVIDMHNRTMVISVKHDKVAIKKIKNTLHTVLIFLSERCSYYY